MKQRILSMLLVIVMVAGMMPAHVLATDPEVLWGTSADNLTGSGTLTEAIAAYASYIQLQRNIESDSSLSFNNSVTLDLNGNTLTVEVTRSGTVGVYVAGDLTVTDSSTDRNGSLTGAGAYNGIIAYGDINVSGGSLTGRSDCENEDLLGYGVYAVGGITVWGGELTGTANGKCG